MAAGSILVLFRKVYWLPVALWLVFPVMAFCQPNGAKKPKTHFPEFYEMNDSLTNTRFYLSEKRTYPTLINADKSHLVRYRSNGNTNLGIGNTWGWLTINIGINFRFVNHDNDLRGRTRFLDLHTQAIGKKFVMDFFGQFYKGVYLLPESNVLPRPSVTAFRLRPDIFTRQIGAHFYYLPNWQKYSCAAAVTQRDWQKKSAGSLMLGGEFNTGLIKGDSALVPGDQRIHFSYPDMTRVQFIQAGIGGGYAYTLVFKKHWFAHASGVVNFSLGHMKDFGGGIGRSHWYFRPNFVVRPSIGYNSKRFNAAILWFSSRLNAGDRDGYFRINATNLRFTLAYRLRPGPVAKKYLDGILRLNPFNGART